MPDGDFAQARYHRVKIFKIDQAEIMSGIYTEPAFQSYISCLDKWSDRFLRVGRVKVGVGLCVKLYTVGACLCSLTDVVGIGPTNIEVRIPSALKRSTTDTRNSILDATSHPALEVRASGASGTRVT